MSHIPILMYHSIKSEPKGSILRGLCVPPWLFNLQLFTLKTLGYQGMCISELMPYLNGQKKGKVFGITFDDGYVNNFENALPILKKFNFTATCYIVSGLIGKNNVWDIAKGVNEKRLMDRKMIGLWIDSGFEIGCHSHNHKRLSHCSSKELETEIRDSKKMLENIFKVPIQHFCYPYGDFSDEVIEHVSKSGFKSAVTTSRGKVNLSTNFLKLPRVLINHRTYPISLLVKILTSYESKKT